MTRENGNAYKTLKVKKIKSQLKCGKIKARMPGRLVVIMKADS